MGNPEGSDDFVAMVSYRNGNTHREEFSQGVVIVALSIITERASGREEGEKDGISPSASADSIGILNLRARGRARMGSATNPHDVVATSNLRVCRSILPPKAETRESLKPTRS